MQTSREEAFSASVAVHLWYQHSSRQQHLTSSKTGSKTTSHHSHEITYQHTFYKWDQTQGESVIIFISAIQQAPQHCNFIELEIALQDWLVCGLLDEKLQYWLFRKKQLTFKKALKEAFTAEAADQSIREVHQSWSPILPKKAKLVHHDNTENDSEVEDEIHQTQEELPKYTEQQTTNRLPCDSCRGSHDWKSCNVCNAECRACGERGHIAVACRATKSRGFLPQTAGQE